jgi:hypothetical protein
MLGKGLVYEASRVASPIAKKLGGKALDMAQSCSWQFPRGAKTMLV